MVVGIGTTVYARTHSKAPHPCVGKGLSSVLRTTVVLHVLGQAHLVDVRALHTVVLGGVGEVDVGTPHVLMPGHGDGATHRSEGNSDAPVAQPAQEGVESDEHMSS